MNVRILLFTLAFITLTAAARAQQYEWQQITTVESVVPGGLGRSRLIYTDAKGQKVEKELENFFSLVGINFGNVLNNDKVIAARINEMTNEGWELTHVTPGVYSAETSTGIFITRYLFRRVKK